MQSVCSPGTILARLTLETHAACRSRGIDTEAARQMLVFSFGAEVTQFFKHEPLMQRVQAAVNQGLATASAAAGKA